MPQAIIWTNADSNHWRIYAALGGDELASACFIFDGFSIGYGLIEH